MHSNDTNKQPKRFGTKALVLTSAVTLALSGAVGGTIAWLISKDTVTNTFTYGDIDITLDETDVVTDDEGNKTNEYEMVPGNAITKDPTVTVEAGSEDCWLFVQLEESANFDDFMTYEIADGWTALEGYENVFYMTVDSPAEDITYTVIKDNTVNVRDDVTKEMLNALDSGETADYPTLTVTAYGVQRDENIEALDTAEEAWALTQETPADSAEENEQEIIQG